jgi:hypothetical protein
MVDLAKPLEWRTHRRQILLKPRAVSQALGATTCRPAGGSLAEGEWSLLAQGEQIVMQKGSSIHVLETLGDDGLGWRGRAVDFHETGSLTGPVAFRSGAYKRPRFPFGETLVSFLGLGLAAVAIILLQRHGVEYGKEVISIWFLSGVGLGTMQLWRLMSLVRSHWDHWKPRAEHLAFPEVLDETVGYRRLDIMVDVIEDGVEEPAKEDASSDED